MLGPSPVLAARAAPAPPEGRSCRCSSPAWSCCCSASATAATPPPANGSARWSTSGPASSAVPGLAASSLGGLGGGQRPVALVSLRVALGLPDRGPGGRILVVATRTGPVGFLVDEVVRVLAYDPATCAPEPIRPSGYVVASFAALGSSWLLIDWDAIRLPAGITSR